MSRRIVADLQVTALAGLRVEIRRFPGEAGVRAAAAAAAGFLDYSPARTAEFAPFRDLLARFPGSSVGRASDC